MTQVICPNIKCTDNENTNCKRGFIELNNNKTCITFENRHVKELKKLTSF